MKAPRISDAEWEVMNVVWAASTPLTSQQIIDGVAKREKWHPKMIRTLLNRLTRKGVLSFERRGRGYLYKARVTQRKCVRAVTQSFIDRVFDGSLCPMLAHFVREQRLSREEISELKRLLEEED